MGSWSPIGAGWASAAKPPRLNNPAIQSEDMEFFIAIPLVNGLQQKLSADEASVLRCFVKSITKPYALRKVLVKIQQNSALNKGFVCLKTS